MAIKVNIIKNMVCLMAIALCMLAFASCGNSPKKTPADNDTTNICMTVSPTDRVIFYIAGSGTITIDWGDGTFETKALLTFNYDRFLDYVDTTYMLTHSYSRSSTRTIKIIGNNITHLTTGKLMLWEHESITNILTRLIVSGTTALKWLGCSNNQLTELDLSKNTVLKGLNCFNNQLTSLDMSANTALTILECGGNQLTKLDLRKNTELTYLGCFINPLKKLDVSNNVELTHLFCSNTQLTELDLNANTALTSLDCQNNKLRELDLRYNKELKNLWCSWNQLTELDLSANTVLTYLTCWDNQLTSLNLGNNNTVLNELRCSRNKLSSNALNTLFRMLNDEPGRKLISITDNPGTKDCDKSIAEEKGWHVDTS